MLLWEASKPALIVLTLGIIYSILQSPAVMSRLKYTFDSENMRFTNESTWWVVLMVLTGVGLTLALAYWIWRIYKTVRSVKKTSSKISRQRQMQTYAIWCATLPILGLILSATLITTFLFWSWRYFDAAGVVVQQLPEWYSIIIGLLGGLGSVVFISLPFFLIFSLYFLAKSKQ